MGCGWDGGGRALHLLGSLLGTKFSTATTAVPYPTPAHITVLIGGGAQSIPCSILPGLYRIGNPQLPVPRGEGGHQLGTVPRLCVCATCFRRGRSSLESEGGKVPCFFCHRWQCGSHCRPWRTSLPHRCPRPSWHLQTSRAAIPEAMKWMDK